MKHRLVFLGWIVSWAVALAANSEPAPTSPEQFFGFTNLWSLHITVRSEDWKAMEPKETGPQRPRGPRPEPDREGPLPNERRSPQPAREDLERDPQSARPPRPPLERDGDPDVGPPGPEGRPQRRPGGFGGPGGPPGMGGPRGPGGPGPRHVEYPWSTASVEFGGQVLTNVGIRFKGNSSYNASRQSLKKPLKLDFDRHVPGRTFFGLGELVLNNNINPMAHLREPLAYDVFRRAGFPASRTAFVKVYLTITGEFEKRELGIYTAIEPVENDFLDRAFGSHKGLLAKPEGIRGLDYLGTDWHAYTNRYEMHGDTKKADLERLVSLTRFVQLASDTEFAANLDQYVDVDNALRFVAVNALLANMDSFLGNGHNYYLFVPRKDPKARFIPWDLNEAFGGHPMAGAPETQADLSVLQPANSANRFVTRLLANEELAARYRAHLQTLLTNAFNADRLIADAQTISKHIGPIGPMRPMGPIDKQFEQWIRLRHTQVREELAGNRQGTQPTLGRPIRQPRPLPDR